MYVCGRAAVERSEASFSNWYEMNDLFGLDVKLKFLFYIKIFSSFSVFFKNNKEEEDDDKEEEGKAQMMSLLQDVFVSQLIGWIALAIWVSHRVYGRF